MVFDFNVRPHNLARATAAAEGAECITVHALASPTGIEEIDTPDANAESVRSLTQAIKLAGAGGRRVVLLVNEAAAACDASLTPLHELVAAGGRAPGRVKDTQLAVWLHDRKRSARVGGTGLDLSGIANDAKAAKELAAAENTAAAAKTSGAQAGQLAGCAGLAAEAVGAAAGGEAGATVEPPPGPPASVDGGGIPGRLVHVDPRMTPG